jgi:hypothetical protein
MATPMTAAQYERALRAEGVRVVEMPGWTTHNRNHKGAWGPVNGVLIHHTAGVGPGIPAFCQNGSADLPGPLCHAVATKDGRVHIPGYGRANHAGSIAANAMASLVAEDGKHPMPGPDSVDGNARLYGLEIENRGDGDDPWPDGQYDQSVRWAAAVCRHHGWTAESVAGHKEVTRRKIDPVFFMDVFRDEVAERLRHAPSWSPEDDSPDPAPAPPEEDPVPQYTDLTSSQIFTVPAGGESIVYFDAEHHDEPGDHPEDGITVLAGHQVYHGVVAVWGPGHQPLAVRMVIQLPQWSDRRTSMSSEAALPEVAGGVRAAGVAGVIGPESRLRVVLFNPGVSNAVVDRVDVRLLSWEK